MVPCSVIAVDPVEGWLPIKPATYLLFVHDEWQRGLGSRSSRACGWWRWRGGEQVEQSLWVVGWGRGGAAGWARPGWGYGAARLGQEETCLCLLPHSPHAPAM